MGMATRTAGGGAMNPALYKEQDNVHPPRRNFLPYPSKHSNTETIMANTFSKIYLQQDAPAGAE